MSNSRDNCDRFIFSIGVKYNIMVKKVRKGRGTHNMREMYIKRCEKVGEDNQCHRFDYYILIDQMEVSGGFACESYGVKVAAPDSGTATEIPNITVSISRIDELMELLTRNAVTPVSLADVVADWL